METKLQILIQVDSERRIVAYAEGGAAQERFVSGIGWTVADDEHWPEYAKAFREAAAILAKLAEQVKPIWTPPPAKVFDCRTRGSH